MVVIKRVHIAEVTQGHLWILRTRAFLANQYGASEKKLSCQLKSLRFFVLHLALHNPLPSKRELARVCRSFTVRSRFLPMPAATACVYWVRGHLTDKTDRRTGHTQTTVGSNCLPAFPPIDRQYTQQAQNEFRNLTGTSTATKQADSCTARKQIRGILYTLKVHHRIQKIVPLLPIMSRWSPFRPQYIYLRTTLTVSFHLHLGLPSAFFS